ncbi:MAG: hypothetical protein AAB426_14640 [Myxococcota bacterium]
MVDLAEARKVAYNYVVDGDRGPTQQSQLPDGYLSVSEIAYGLARLRNLHKLASSGDASSGMALPAERYAQMIKVLTSMLPAARVAEARGERGAKYMAEQFYTLDMSPQDLERAIHGDVNMGDNNGEVTRQEYCRSSWYPGKPGC